MFDQNAYFQLTEDRAKADLVIYSKVLRAKVDAINSNTNRLQMVVSVEVKNLADDSSYIEHQNRFILFKSSEDEQKVAAGLMQKLLTKAGKLKDEHAENAFKSLLSQKRMTGLGFNLDEQNVLPLVTEIVGNPVSELALKNAAHSNPLAGIIAAGYSVIRLANKIQKELDAKDDRNLQGSR